MRLRGFLLGLAGGAIGAALVILVLVLFFDFGQVRQETVVRTTTTPASYSGGDDGALSPAQIYDELSGGVVMILASFNGGSDVYGQPQGGQALGTGFVVDDEGYILTNAHVVDESGQRASDVTVVFNKGGNESQRVDGELVGVDVSSDVALIKVDPGDVDDLNPLPLGDSDEVQVGEPVVAIGNPLGYDFSITSGIVSATGRTLQAPNGMRIPDGIQTDAAINQGNSGGPLINGAGQVIGINEQIASQGGGNDGLGFAVPINTAKRVMEQLKESGTVQYAWLGVSGQNVTSDVARVLDLSVDSGALVEQVSPDSPASEAGLRGGDRSEVIQGQEYIVGGDVIIKADGKDIPSFDDLVAFLGTKQPGDKVEFTIVRDGDEQTVTATLAERPAEL